MSPPQPRRPPRFVAVRGRLWISAVSAPGLIFLIFLGIDIVATDQAVDPWAIFFSLLPFVIVLVGLLVRALTALDLSLQPDSVKYRTAFRTRVFERSEIRSCEVGEVAAAYGTRRALRPYLVLVDGKKVPLRLFGGLKPTSESTSAPAWILQMRQLVATIERWISDPKLLQSDV